ALEVVHDNSEDLEVMVQRLAVPLVPEVDLVHPVPALAHVDRLEAGMLAFENGAPGVLVVDLIAKRERVARADEANPPWGHGRGEVVVVTEALPVSAKIDPVTIQVPIEESAPV